VRWSIFNYRDSIPPSLSPSLCEYMSERIHPLECVSRDECAIAACAQIDSLIDPERSRGISIRRHDGRIFPFIALPSTASRASRKRPPGYSTMGYVDCIDEIVDRTLGGMRALRYGR